MNKYVAVFVSAALVLLAAEFALSHRDMSEPLFVASDGVDAGRCQDATAPCRSIAYALAQAGKGAEIRVAAGRYAIEQSEDLFLLVSGAVNIQGGYDRSSDYVLRDDQPSTLTGVPEQYRATLRGNGFHVIADLKGADTTLARKTKEMFVVQSKLLSLIHI